MKTLNPKQQRFVEEYLLDHNGAGAAVRARYSPRSAKEIAAELLTKPHIRAAVAAQEALAAASIGMTRHRVLEGLQKAVDEARRQADPTAMIAAWREIAKICGYYTLKLVQVDVRRGDANSIDPWRLEAMSDTDLGLIAFGQVGGGGYGGLDVFHTSPS